jgi:hypothetical protein
MFFPRVPSNQKESSTEASLTVFLLASKMSYYGGAELLEPPETACGVNYTYGADGRNLGSIL